MQLIAKISTYRSNVCIRKVEQGEHIVGDSRISVKFSGHVKSKGAIICQRVINGCVMNTYVIQEPCKENHEACL